MYYYGIVDSKVHNLHRFEWNLKILYVLLLLVTLVHIIE